MLAGRSRGRQRPPSDDEDAQQSQAMASLQDEGALCHPPCAGAPCCLSVSKTRPACDLETTHMSSRWCCSYAQGCCHLSLESIAQKSSGNAAAGVERIIDSFGAVGWEEIARLGPMGRTTEECWKQWVHQLRPSLNRGPWSDDENVRLAGLVSRLGTHAVSPAFASAYFCRRQMCERPLM